jgi:hypothetical protein
MSDRADRFVTRWIAENIQAEGYMVEGDYAEAAKFVEECLLAAKSADISPSELEDEFPDLLSFMALAIEEVNDHEAARLAEENR